jgi:hypothetical protein
MPSLPSMFVDLTVVIVHIQTLARLYKTVFPNGINSHDTPLHFEPEGPIEELIVSGVAFGEHSAISS